MTEQAELSAKEIATYLQQHPDFFNENSELLETLLIPHPTRGNTVSLITRQLEILRDKQQQFENQLSNLIDIAKDNDATSSRIHELTLALLNASTLEMAIENLQKVLKECFFSDFWALKIIGEAQDSKLEAFFTAKNNMALLEEAFSEEFATKLPKCGFLEEKQARVLFGESFSEVKSCAIIPILYPGLTALLVIGSRDENRFCPNMGSLFLTQIAEIVGTRLLGLLKQTN